MTSPSSEEWGRFFEQLVDMVEDHVKEEEGDIFPKAQKVIGADRAKQIEPRFLAAKKAVAHTVSAVSDVVGVEIDEVPAPDAVAASDAELAKRKKARVAEALKTTLRAAPM